MEWNTASNFESWTRTQLTGAAVSGGVLSATTNGTDPQLLRSNFASGPDLDLGFNDYLRVGNLPGDVCLTNNEWNSDNEMSSKHFRFFWDASRAAQGVNATTARGALRNAEEAWQVFV